MELLLLIPVIFFYLYLAELFKAWFVKDASTWFLVLVLVALISGLVWVVFNDPSLGGEVPHFFIHQNRDTGSNSSQRCEVPGPGR